MITGLICKGISLKIQSNGAGTPFNPSFGMQQVRPAAIDILAVVKFDTGCEKLAVIEENIVTAFNEVGGDSNNVITVTLNRAYRVCAITLCKKFIDPRLQRARQGQYQDAIAVLLEPDVWRGLSLHDYSQWASQIWHIVVLRASRRLSHFTNSRSHCISTKVWTYVAASCDSIMTC